MKAKLPGRLLDVGGLIGCFGALCLQWGIAYVYFSESLFSRVWTILAGISSFIAKSWLSGASLDMLAKSWVNVYFPLWTCCLVVFGFVYARLVLAKRRAGPRQIHILLFIQLAIAVITGDILPKIFAMELPLILPFRRALYWLISGWILMALACLQYLTYFPNGWNYTDLLRIYLDFFSGVALDITFFAFGLLAAQERQGRRELEHAHAALGNVHGKLLAAQLLLADRVRKTERLRIAEQMQAVIDDKIARQLVCLRRALKISDGAAKGSLETSVQIITHLEGEIRRLVDADPQGEAVDLQKALATLCAGIPGLHISISHSGSSQVADPVVANALFRCVQEAITNTLRHADAEEMAISLQVEPSEITLEIIDDGKTLTGDKRRADSEGNLQAGAGSVSGDANGEAGAPSMTPDSRGLLWRRVKGSGLRGMSERVASLKGTFMSGSLPSGGFFIKIRVPHGDGGVPAAAANGTVLA